MIVKSLTSRGMRTRAALLRAGREAFEEHGYDTVRIDDVCARAGVSHGTFYTYFDSKESLFARGGGRGRGRDVRGERRGTVRARRPVRPHRGRQPALPARLGGQLPAGADAGAGAATADDRLRAAAAWSCARSSSGAAPTALRRLQEQGLADPTLDPRLTAVMLGGMVEHFAHVWLDLGEQADERTAVDTCSPRSGHEPSA